MPPPEELILGGDLLPSNAKYECRVSQKGYTAGFVCVQQGQNAAKVCERCYGVTYTVYVSPLLLCASECLP